MADLKKLETKSICINDQVYNGSIAQCIGDNLGLHQIFGLQQMFFISDKFFSIF
jgi:hypothetical protein